MCSYKTDGRTSSVAALAAKADHASLMTLSSADSISEAFASCDGLRGRNKELMSLLASVEETGDTSRMT